MNPRLTRDQLLRRGAAGVAFLSLPSLLAACGGGGGNGESSGELNDVLNFSNWELYIDTPDTRKAAGLTGGRALAEDLLDRGAAHAKMRHMVEWV